MSDLDLITPPLLDEKEFSGDMSDDGDDEEGGKDAMDEEESHSASKTPSVAAAAAAQKPHLSAYLQGFASTYNNLTAKKAKERIKCIEVENPKVHQFAAGEKFFNVVKNGAGLVSVKKLRADWERLRHEYIVEARLTDNSLILGYVTCGKKNELVHLPVASTERFVMVPVANLAAFHPPSFDPASHFHVTRQDQRRELVTIDSPAGGKVSFRAVNFDPRFILKAAKASERTARPKKPAAAPDKNSRDLGESICNLSRRLILELQRKEELSSVPVLVEHSPHFKKLLAQIGPENFPVMRSEDTDGLRLLPYDIGSGQGRMAECLKNLRAVHDGVSTEHLHGRWDTDPILRALLIQSMAKQFSTLPATRLLRHSGKALSERNISGFMSEFTDSDHGCAFIADAIAAMTLARDIFAELVSLDHSLLRTAAPLIAFANYAERLGGLHAQEFIFDSEKADNAPNLRCALTGSVIVPGMAFYLICAKTRPKDSQSAVRTMVAVVAKAVHDADMRLYPMQAPTKTPAKRPSAAPSLSVSSIDAAPENAAKPKRAPRGTPLTQEEQDEKRRIKNERDKERRRASRAKALEEKKESSPPSTPDPSPSKTKKRAPSTSTPGKEPAQKKARVDAARDYFGIAPSLERADLVLEGRALFQAFAQFTTTDPSVNQAMAIFDAKAPRSYDPSEPPSVTFMTWLKKNAFTFLHLVEVLETFTRKLSSYSDDIKEAIEGAKRLDEKGGDPMDVDDDSEAGVLDDIDDETRAYMIAIGAELPEKKKKAPPPSQYVVKPAPVRNDPLFTELIKLAAKKPPNGSKFFIALGELGPNALTLPMMLAIAKAISAPKDDIDAHKKTVGNYLAAFKWLFPTASN